MATYRNTKAQNKFSGGDGPLQALTRESPSRSVAAASCQDSVAKRHRSSRQDPATRQLAEEDARGSNLSVQD